MKRIKIIEAKYYDPKKGHSQGTDVAEELSSQIRNNILIYNGSYNSIFPDFFKSTKKKLRIVLKYRRKNHVIIYNEDQKINLPEDISDKDISTNFFYNPWLIALVGIFILTPISSITIFKWPINLNKNSETTLKEVAKSPLLKYDFSKENKSFTVENNGPAQIKKVNWMIPYVKGEKIFFINYDWHKNFSWYTIGDHFSRESHVSNIEADKVERAVECFLYPLFGVYGGIPILVVVEYDNVDIKTKDLLLIKRMDTSEPFVSFIKSNITDEEKLILLKGGGAESYEEMDYFKNVFNTFLIELEEVKDKINSNMTCWIINQPKEGY